MPIAGPSRRYASATARPAARCASTRAPARNAGTAVIYGTFKIGDAAQARSPLATSEACQMLRYGPVRGYHANSRVRPIHPASIAEEALGGRRPVGIAICIGRVRWKSTKRDSADPVDARPNTASSTVQTESDPDIRPIPPSPTTSTPSAPSASTSTSPPTSLSSTDPLSNLPSQTGSTSTSPDSALPSSTGILQLLSLAKPQWPLLASGVFFLTVSTGVNLGIPWAIGRIIDFFAPGSEVDKLFGLPLEQATMALAGVLLVGALANSGRSICLRLAGQRTVMRIRYVYFGWLSGFEAITG